MINNVQCNNEAIPPLKGVRGMSKWSTLAVIVRTMRNEEDVAIHNGKTVQTTNMDCFGVPRNDEVDKANGVPLLKRTKTTPNP